MSTKALPFLFINMGGEMMYILDQRLKAQNIPLDKTKKVLHDIIGTMFNSKFMDELFKPQDLYSKKALRTLYDRLAHSSIMRLNTASMDKLYDLMTMAVKYQVSLCSRPQDLLMITFNHLDTLRTFVEESPLAGNLVENVYRLLNRNYGSLSPGNYMLTRQTLLGFFQDIHIRVSIFLRDKVQTPSGRFVLSTKGQLPAGIEVPGQIRFYNDKGDKVNTVEFNCGGSYSLGKRQGSMALVGDRITILGKNIYSTVRPLDTSVSHVGGSSASYSEQETNVPDPRAKAQLELLQQLIGSRDPKKGPCPEFKLNLFNTDQEEEELAVSKSDVPSASGCNIINIDASKKKKSAELCRIMGDMDISSTGDAGHSDDLLELMDSAN